MNKVNIEFDMFGAGMEGRFTVIDMKLEDGVVEDWYHEASKLSRWVQLSESYSLIFSFSTWSENNKLPLEIPRDTICAQINELANSGVSSMEIQPNQHRKNHKDHGMNDRVALSHNVD